MKNSLLFKGIVFFGAIALFGQGCATFAPEPAPQVEVPKEDIVIGATLPLTGDLAEYGDSLRKALELSVNQVNGKGGVNGRALKLIVENDKCNPDLVANTMTKLIDLDKSSAIIGPACPDAALTAAKLAEAKKVVIISPSVTDPTFTDSSDYTFRLVVSDAIRIKKLSETIYTENAENPSFGVIWENDIYNLALRTAFISFVADKRADVEVDIYFSTGTKDFKKEIEEIKNLPAIFISVNSEALTKILVELEDRNYKGKIYVSTASLDDRDLIKTAAQNLAGVKFASFENYTGETYDDFAAAYKIAYNETPGIHAAETYDAVQILAKAMEDKGFDAAGIVGGLYGIKNYNGASGKITFDNNGDVSDRSFDYRVGHYDEEKEEVSFENLGSL